MTCIGAAPTTLDTWLAAVDRCATQAGGSNWPSLAMTGLATVVVAVVCLLFLFLVVGAIREG